jgi:hypothetical protein
MTGSSTTGIYYTLEIRQYLNTTNKNPQDHMWVPQEGLTYIMKELGSKWEMPVL